MANLPKEGHQPKEAFRQLFCTEYLSFESIYAGSMEERPEVIAKTNIVNWNLPKVILKTL